MSHKRKGRKLSFYSQDEAAKVYPVKEWTKEEVFELNRLKRVRECGNSQGGHVFEASTGLCSLCGTSVIQNHRLVVRR